MVSETASTIPAPATETRFARAWSEFAESRLAVAALASSWC